MRKFNTDRREKTPKQMRCVSNWPEYSENMRQRGRLTVWIDEDSLDLWSAPRRTTRGGLRHYSDLAIGLFLTLGVVYRGFVA